MYYPKILVVANNSFSLTNSNGRTLGNFFIGWPKESLAQFCISTDGPNYELCDNYYCLTDRSMLNAFLKFKSPKRSILSVNTQTSQKRARQVKKTAISALIRHVIWMSGKWNNEEFNQWVQNFSPDVVLLQSGDSAFMLDIALRVSKERCIPLVVFNTEGYYFFKKNYLSKGVCDSILFPLYHVLYKRKFKSLMRYTNFSIFGNNLLKRDYDKEFGGESIVLYTSSTLCANNTPFNQEHPTFSYLGNLGFDRPAALIEVGEVLHSINSQYYIDVYGRATPEVVRKLESSEGIRYHGFVQYNEVVRIMGDSDVLFHVEGQGERWKESLRYGFSTKIADSIASGKSFVLYSFPEIACAYYIKETGAGWFASNKEDLKNVLMTIIFNREEREKKLKIAQRVATDFHSLDKNREKFYSLISQVIASGC